MSKLYYPTPDELQGDTPLDERRWMEKYQYLLVKLANTDTGRALLCIDSWQQRPHPVIRITKNMVQFHLGYQHGHRYTLSDIRVGAKWGNVVRYRWREVAKAIDRMLLLDMRERWKPLILPTGEVLLPIGGATSTTFYPEPHPESTTCDGHLGKDTGSGGAWSSVHWSDVAVSDLTDDTSEFLKCNMNAKPPSQWYDMRHSFVLFDASGVADDQVKSSATYEFVATGVFEDNNSIEVALGTCNPESNDELIDADYNKLTNTRQASDKALSTITHDSSTYTQFTVTGTGLSAIDIGSGITKICVALVPWLDDSEPTNAEYQINWYSADQSGDTTDPKLVLIHFDPSKSMLLMFGVGR